MRAYVFKDAALAKHAGRFVWLSIDTEQPTGEAFLEKYPMEAWPTLFVIDPSTEKAQIKWLGSLNVSQLEKLLDDGEYAVRRAHTAPDDSASWEARLAAADQRRAANELSAAAEQYAALLAQAPRDWARRGRVASALVSALAMQEAFEACAARSRELAPTFDGATLADVASTGLSCALSAPPGTAWAPAAVADLEPRVRASLNAPGLLADDRSSVFESLIEAREAAHDAAGVTELARQWWDFLAQQADRVTDPEARAAFDPHRVLAAQKLGDPGRVIPVLQATERALPGDYNAPARLAAVYLALGRLEEGLAANARARAKVYGPRAIRVMETQAGLLEKKGDLTAARQALQEALALARAMPLARRSERQIHHLQAALDHVGKAP